MLQLYQAAAYFEQFIVLLLESILTARAVMCHWVSRAVFVVFFCWRAAGRVACHSSLLWNAAAYTRLLLDSETQFIMLTSSHGRGVMWH
jgi:hypothetical protein